MLKIQSPFVWSKKTEEQTGEEDQPHPDLRELMKGLRSKSKFTITAAPPPKIVKGEGKKLLLEYGDGMFQMPHAKLLEGADMLKTAFSEEKFSVWNKLNGRGTFPIALKARFLPKASVLGQLYRVPENTLECLDRHRENGVLFTRRLVPLLIPYRREYVVNNGEDTRTVEVPSYKRIFGWMYVGTTAWKKPLEWDTSFFRNSGGSEFQLAQKFRDWNLNRKFFLFKSDDVTSDNRPKIDLRYFCTRSSQDQNIITDIDIQEEEEWTKALEKKALDLEQTYPTSRLS